jgi:MFS family permease
VVDSPLSSPSYRWLLGGRSVSMLGNAIAPIALAFAVLDLSGSPKDLGIVIGARSVAHVLLLLFGGVIADRVPRAFLLVSSALASAATQGAVAALVLTGSATIPLLALLGALNGAVAAVNMPATQGLTPQTVGPDQLQPANAMLRLAASSMSVLGALAGGGLVAAVGPGWGIAIDAATFAVAGFMFSRLPLAAVVVRTSNLLHDLRTGWTEFVARRWVWIVVVQFTVVNAAYVGAVAVLGPTVADGTIGRGSWGIVLAAGAAGLVVGGVIALRTRPRRPLLVGTAAVLALALPVATLAAKPTTPLLALAFFLSGICSEQFGVAWDVSLQQHIPQDRLSRVYSYDAVGSFVAIPLGQVLVGPAAQSFGVNPTLLVCAGLIVVATLLALLSRSIRSLERLSDPVPAAG